MHHGFTPFFYISSYTHFDKTQQLKCNETFNIPLRIADEAISRDWSDGGTMMTDFGAPVLPEPDGAASSAATD